MRLLSVVSSKLAGRVLMLTLTFALGCLSILASCSLPSPVANRETLQTIYKPYVESISRSIQAKSGETFSIALELSTAGTPEIIGDPESTWEIQDVKWLTTSDGVEHPGRLYGIYAVKGRQAGVV